ncbi:hypothetical protein JCM6882_005763 [Rhodosporidiobolus microsporus]
MHFSSFVTLATLAIAGVEAKCHGHRRHHSKAASSGASSSSWSSSTQSASGAAATDAFVGAAKVDAKVSALAGSTSWSSKASSTASASSSSSSGTSSSSSLGWGLKDRMKKNNIYFGFLPDDGSGGGTSHTIQQIDSAMGQKSAAQGWYAQAQSGTLFDGSQFKWRKDQIISGGVFQPAVMPTGGWWGLKYDDDQQARAICKVMKEYTDEGVEVWLRFAHEVNYYQQDGTYQGGVDDFKEGWAVVAKACAEIAPEVKMWYTPNVASLDSYDEYFPDDASTVHLIGVDWYPKQTSDFDFATGSGNMKAFHDKYCSDSGIKFAIGEIGLGIAATMQQRLNWLENIMGSGESMPHMIAVSWFNYYKDQYSYKVAVDTDDYLVKQYFAK